MLLHLPELLLGSSFKIPSTQGEKILPLRFQLNLFPSDFNPLRWKSRCPFSAKRLCTSSYLCISSCEVIAQSPALWRLNFQWVNLSQPQPSSGSWILEHTGKCSCSLATKTKHNTPSAASRTSCKTTSWCPNFCTYHSLIDEGQRANDLFMHSGYSRLHFHGGMCLHSELALLEIAPQCPAVHCEDLTLVWISNSITSSSSEFSIPGPTCQADQYPAVK